MFEDRSRLELSLFTVAPLYLLVGVLLSLAGKLGWEESLVLAAPLAVGLWFLFGPALHLCRAVPLHGTPVPKLLLTHLAAAAMASAAWVAVARFSAWGLGHLWTGLEPRLEASVPLLAAIGGLFFLLAAALQHAALAAEATHEAERRALASRVLSRETELKSLRAQLQPHFLFNALNSISALTTANPEGAREMCLKLADLLRQSLRLGAKETIPLREEIDLVLAYLSIEQVRFGERLRVELDVSEDARSCLVPPLLLQPLVENAVRHGIAQLVEGGRVRIEAAVLGDALRLVVENERDPEAPASPGEGLGLQNVEKRLAAGHGRAARVDVYREPGRFRVEVRLPVITPSTLSGRG